MNTSQPMRLKIKERNERTAKDKQEKQMALLYLQDRTVTVMNQIKRNF